MTHLEEEFVKVLGDITENVTERLMKDTVLKAISDLESSIHGLKENYKDLMSKVLIYKESYSDNMKMLSDDLEKIRNQYQKESEAVINDIACAKTLYNSISTGLLKDVTHGKDLFDDSFNKINKLLMTLEKSIDGFNNRVQDVILKKVENKSDEVIAEITKELDLINFALKTSTDKLRDEIININKEIQNHMSETISNFMLVRKDIEESKKELCIYIDKSFAANNLELNNEIRKISNKLTYNMVLVLLIILFVLFGMGFILGLI